ncbi:MAG TPA: FHA domain-containing protein [Vicinamibacterales bacterium]|nr:FHA domain-containing protein [Vicinamibacterales bacterium]
MGSIGRLIVKYEGHVLMTSTVSTPMYPIGRLPDNSLVLTDATVSGNHAQIRSDLSGAVLIDLGSELGTFFGGEQVLPLQPHALTDGAQFRIGPYEITFRAESERLASDVEVEPAAMLDDESPFLVRDDLPVPIDSTSRYLPFLPVIFHENDFLQRFLQIFEAVWEPLEQRQDHIDLFFSPRTCPASWLPWIASWFGLSIEPYLSEARARALLAEGIDIYRWRGTRYGLTRVIEVCLGIRPIVVVRPDDPHVIRVCVSPSEIARGEVMSTLRELIATHKPAHMGYVIEVQS